MVRTRTYLFGLAWAAGLAAITWLIFAGIAAIAVRRAELAWAGAWLSFAEFRQRFPAAETNADAERLEELAACVGIDFARRREAEQPRRPAGCAVAVSDAAERYEAIRAALGEHERAQLARVDDRFDPPPAGVAAWLDAQAVNLVALRDHLRASEPRWRVDLALGYQAPLPNLLAVLNLHRVLVLAGSEAQRQGRPDEAAAWLDASLRLDAALVERPELISQLVSAAAARLHAGLLRRLDPPPPGRAEDLAAYDRWRSFLTAIEGEGRVHLEGDAGGALTPQGDQQALGRLLGVVSAPWTRLSLAGVSGRLAGAVEALAVQDACAQPPAAVTAGAEQLFPRWNVIGRVAWPNLADAARKVGRLRLDIELSGHVVALREARSRDGRWPETGSGIPSAQCPAERWLVRALPDDRLELSFSRELPAAAGPVLELPLAAALSPPAP